LTIYEQQLAAVQQAILDIITGKVESYEIGNRSVTKLNIDVLYKIQKDLEGLVARERQGGIPVQGIEPIL
jgi:hypothetical protein